MSGCYGPGNFCVSALKLPSLGTHIITPVTVDTEN